MRCILSLFFLLNTQAVSAQHYHKCTTYYQNHGEYASDTQKHLQTIQYFNDYGKLVREHDYRYIHNGELNFDTICRRWAQHIYNSDTVLLKSVYWHYRNSKVVIVDTATQVYHYNNLGLLKNDTTFYFGETYYQSYDLIGKFIGSDTEVNEFYYDDLGRKILVFNTEYMYNGVKKFGHKKKQTFIYDDNNRLIKSTLLYLHNTNKNPLLSDIGDFTYKYLNGNLIERTQHRYNKNDTDIFREIYTYEFSNDKIIKEEIDFVSVGNRRKKIIEYSYFPDKRIIKEIEYDVVKSYIYE